MIQQCTSPIRERTPADSIRSWLRVANKFADEKQFDCAYHSLASAVLLLTEHLDDKPSNPEPESKFLTLADLKRQVDQAVQNETWCNLNQPFRFSESSDMLAVIGDFEIRRRK